MSTEKTPIVTEIVESIFTPGVNNRVELIIHTVFAMLQLTLMALLVLSEFNYHVVLLNFIAIALWMTLYWFIGQLKEAPGLDTRDYSKPIESEKDK